MSTVFPFNQASKLPGLVIDQIKPMVMDQLKKFDQISNKLEQRLNSISKNAKCNDAQIIDLKRKLRQLQLILNNLNNIQQRLQPLTDRLQKITQTVNAVAGILLAIPAVIGVPEGPKGQIIQTIADVVAGITAVINVLNILLKMINKILSIANNLISKAEQVLSNLCPATSANTNNLTNNAGLNAIDTTNSNLSADTILTNNAYPSEFYNSFNVSDSDIQYRVDTINQLIEDQLNVIQNLNEAPSKVLMQAGIPGLDIGNVGDYYIDINTQTIYGPKPSQNSWT